jgi:hypothetical protein
MNILKYNPLLPYILLIAIFCYSYARTVESRKRSANYNPCTNGNIIQLK